MTVRAAVAGLLATALAASGLAALPSPPSATKADDRFREANELVRAGDYPKAIALYGELAASGHESASLYWNWAQAASARGAQGEALWALLRARDLDPGDRAVARDVERVREALNLDPAEIAPEPLAAAGRWSRRFRLDLLALALFVLSLAAHALGRLPPRRRWTGNAAGVGLGLGLLAAAVPVAASFARPTATVVRRAAPLLDAASPTAETAGSLREGEVVPVLESSGDWLRVEDNAGARGWAHVDDVRRLDTPPGRRPADAG
ncbi:MAG TPA: SH3 domain-containing protein [Vicinamibacteria bacterium]|nr:SH3 domain-containing protein [Vicinamibacteria bacterium]